MLMLKRITADYTDVCGFAYLFVTGEHERATNTLYWQKHNQADSLIRVSVRSSTQE